MRDYVVAIDLGTARTAYSWKSAMDPDPSVGVPDMQPNEDIVGKSPTTLLVGGSTGADEIFTPSGVEAYGRVAQDLYANNDIPHGSQLFKHFKMQLHKEPTKQNFDDLRDAVTKSASGRAEMGLEEVFVLALQFIKQVALETIATTGSLTAEDVSWVLTVPVCCSNPAKQFMRHAAIKAGYIKGEDDDAELTLCMEPMAACLALGDRLDWNMNDKYLVIDCGGGTVDISAFEVDSVKPASLAQLGEPVGGPWGSTNVDKLFEDYLKDFVLSVARDAGPRSRRSFLASSAMYRITQSWERAKVGLRSVQNDCRIDLSELSHQPLEVTMEAMDEGRQLKNAGGEELVGGDGTWDLVLRPAQLRKFFQPQCDNIARAVSEELEKPELEGLTSVVMVGGFSSSKHVQEAVQACVRNKYPDKSVKVIIPKSPDLAIAQGAAHYVQVTQRGHVAGTAGTPFPVPMFKSVTSTHSYGILVSDAMTSYVPTLFDPYFVRGQGYDMNHTVRKEYTVEGGRPFTLSINSSASPDIHEGPNRLDEIGGRKVLQDSQAFTVTPPRPQELASNAKKLCSCLSVGAVVEHPEDNKVTVYVEFSLRGIELHVKVKSNNGKVLLEQTTRFLST